MKILTVFGTRPEAIKLAPVLAEIQDCRSVRKSVICVTGQHREMLDQILSLFQLKPHYDLNIMTRGQDLFDISINTLAGLRKVLSKEEPDVVLVQGDTTSAFFAALAAFYCQIPVAHVEAGLRTFEKYNPFPEELNRTLITAVAEYHFAPTEQAFRNLVALGVPRSNIYLTGNTIVDAAQAILARPTAPFPEELRSLEAEAGCLVVLTFHRRESFGRPAREVLAAIGDLLARNEDMRVVFPVHPNPNVRKAVSDALGEQERLLLTTPLPYDLFIKLLERADLIITDSGGIQEEATVLAKPVIVVREVTERQEAVRAGIAFVTGRSRASIVRKVEQVLRDGGRHPHTGSYQCPYGDGKAAKHIVEVLTTRLSAGGQRSARLEHCSAGASKAPHILTSGDA